MGQLRRTRNQYTRLLLIPSASILLSVSAFGQQDQGAVQGTITDISGAVLPNATITLTNTDQGLALTATTDSKGTYFFSPIKIGNYKIQVKATGFQEVTQEHLTLSAQQRLDVDLKLTPGSQSENVTVNTIPPELQTEEASVNQVFTEQQLNDTPLAGRNWVFIAQLSAGAAPPAGSRGAGTGDFAASGSRSDENNFILDGVDNNVNVVDFINGASFTVLPPPDALSEVKLQTSSSDAEFGHSSGAVVNASIKSGTNSFHGSLWEYARNDAFNTHQYFDSPGEKLPEYRQNLFGGTLGGPIIKNHLFFFGDVQGNRIVNGTNEIITVPTLLERQGNFSELLNPAYTGGAPTYLFQQRSGGGPNPPTTPPGPGPGSTIATATPYQQSYNGQLNVLNPAAIDPFAQSILNLYPLPNRVNTSTNGLLNDNYTQPLNNDDNTVQWDGRLDYNLSERDRAFARNSYEHEYQIYPPPLGPILDGGSFGTDGNEVNVGDNFALSETHVFSPKVVNEFRFGYNYGHFYYIQPNATNPNFAASLGFGGVPGGSLNGGLPNTSVGSGVQNFGAPNYYPSNENENVWQALDNVTFNLGNHSLRAGVSIQRIEFSTLQPPAGHNDYTYNGNYSSAYGVQNTGTGLADFLSQNQNNAYVTTATPVIDVRWDRSFYVQDDWKVNPKLTLNLGLRMENQTPYFERHNAQADFYPTEGVTYDPTDGQQGQSHSAGVYVLPESSRSTVLPANFSSVLAKDDISIQYSSNRYLINYPLLSYGPRIGAAYKLDDKDVVRAGFGIFFGGLESVGFAPNLGLNYPFTSTPSITNPGNLSCTYNNGCLTDGISLQTGLGPFFASGGITDFGGTPSLRGIANNLKTPNTQQWNLSFESQVSNTLSATIAYVGEIARHQTNFPNFNSSPAITPICNSAGLNGTPTNLPCGTGNSQNPFSDVGLELQINNGFAVYHSLQTKLEKRMSNNLSFLTTYTWSHQMTDAGTSIAQNDNFTSAGGAFNYNLLGTRQGFANGPEDVRNRFTLSGEYALPFGKNQRFLNRVGPLTQAFGGWSADLTEQIQDGEPFTVGTANITGPNNLGQNAILVGAPFKGGGTPDPSLNFPINQLTGAQFTCPTTVHNLAHWFNPCAFRNPLPASAVTSVITTAAGAAPFLGDRDNQLPGVGYNRTNLSIFKSFPLVRETQLQARADIFNVFNTPAFILTGGNDGPNGGTITPGSYRFFQNDTPNSRFFQFSLKLSY
jgi:hypothetical protein